MTENYIQYLAGFNIENINFSDFEKAISDILITDDEHGAFWVSVYKEEEYGIETDKFLNIAVVFNDHQINYKAKNWEAVKELYQLLLDENFDKILQIIKQ
ncbi:MAG: hypothetical protein KBS61_00400 [Chryseobacterium sp.]|nr:hypothetical protein [Candidatus Chryseobacterium enterohippi]